MPYDSPRPSSQPPGSTGQAVAKDNLITLDLMAVLPAGSDIENRKGEKVSPFADVAQGATDAAQSALESQQSATASAQSALDAQLAADNASTTSNFLGNWVDLTGAQLKGVVAHNGERWQLLVDVADITLTEPSTSNSDYLIIFSDLGAIARSLNVTGGEVIYSADSVTVLDNVLYIYDATAQIIYITPELDGAGETIVSVVGDQLQTNTTLYTMIKLESGRDYAETAINESANVKIYPEAIEKTLTTGAQTDNVSIGIDSLRVDSAILQAWNNNFNSLAHVLSNISTNAFNGYDVTTDQGVFEFVSLDVKRQRNALDINGYNVLGNGTDESDKLAKIESDWPNRNINLINKDVTVLAVPTGCVFKNGYFVVDNADQGQRVFYPQNETLKRSVLQLETGDAYSSWPQDSGSCYNGVLLASYNIATDHTNDDGHHVVATSQDGGKSIVSHENLFQSSLGDRLCFSAGVINGQEMRIVNKAQTDHNLSGRRRYEQVKYSDMRITSSNNLIVIRRSGLGVKPGDRFKVLEWAGGNVGGINIEGQTFTVGAVFSSNFNAVASGMTSGSDITAYAKIEFLQDDFVEMKYDGGQSLGDLLIAAPGGPTSPPTLIHSMSLYDSTSTNGNIVIGMHGGGLSGPRIAILSNLFSLSTTASPVVSVRSIGGLTQGVEPTITYDPASQDSMGFIRSQGAGYGIRFWRANGSDIENAVTQENDNHDFATLSPIPCRVAGSDLYFCFSGTRDIGAPVGGITHKRGNVALYFGVCKLSETGDIWENSRIIKVRDLYFSDMNNSTSTNAVGVPSMAYDDQRDFMHLIYSTEQRPLRGDFDGHPKIEIMTIPLSEPENDIETSTQRLVDINRGKYLGAYGGAGGKQIGNMDIVRDSEGIYSLSFTDDKGNAVTERSEFYVPIVSVNSTNPRMCTHSDKTESGFKVHTFLSTGTPTDVDFTVFVDVFEDFVRDNWRN